MIDVEARELRRRALGRRDRDAPARLDAAAAAAHRWGAGEVRGARLLGLRGSRNAPGRTSVTPRTLFDKIWEEHIVREVAGRADAPLRRPAPGARGDLAAGVRGPPARRTPRPPARADGGDDGPQRADDRRPDRDGTIAARSSRRCARNCEEFGSRCTRPASGSEGIVHVIGPELGLTQPGHDDRLRRLAHRRRTAPSARSRSAIGTSEVEHVLATQTLPQSRPRTMLVELDGEPRAPA